MTNKAGGKTTAQHCTECNQLRHDREAARQSGDLSKVSDCTVLLTRHKQEHTDPSR
ncbi:hypothetical protein [Streptomyces sp. NPDC048639]|uniref:hypothetical protein n=1 Tax=Streptomyces sp. NPDC048639 TaxID=3365581 RepID=UPI003719CE06